MIPLYAVVTVLILLGVLMALVRALKGPTAVDRVLAVNVIGTKTVVVIALIGFLYGRPHFLDLALIYALINFITTIAFLKYLEKGRLG
jgi:multicomponent Na+:H+ antiporter subunit F